MPPEITRERLSFSMTRKVKYRFKSRKLDRFKRVYIVWLDRNNSEPTGQIERTFNVPMTDAGPLDIPDHHLRFPEDEPWRVDVHFLEYARYLKGALEEWALKLEGFIAESARGEPIEKAHRKAGPKPQDWRLIVLMSRGDPWCLGFTERRTPAVEAIIGKAPTKAQIRAQEKRGPKDLMLDPELEALVQGSAQVLSRFADEEEIPVWHPEVEDDDTAPITREARPTSRFQHVPGDEVIDPESEMKEFLAAQTGAGNADEDEDDGELTGDIDLDAELASADDGATLAEEIEERVDPKATGGKKQNPAKNRSKAARE